MPRLSHAHELARQQIVQLGNSGLSVHPLAERLIESIQLAVGSDGAQLCGLDPSTLLFNRLLALSPLMRSFTPGYLRKMYLHDPIADFTHPNLMRAGLRAVAFHDRLETLWGLPRHLTNQFSGAEFYRGYHAFTGAKGGILRAFFPADGQWIAALDLARFEVDKPFRPTDVAFLRLVAPMVGQVLRRALEREQAMASASRMDSEAWGVLVLGPNKQVQSSTPAAESWLKVLQAADVPLEHHLPTAIWSAVAGLSANQGSLPSLRIPTPKGLLRIEASPMDAEGTVAVVLMPPPEPITPAIPARWNLTRQEQQVVEQILRGLSNRHIAEALKVSENTVESHLKHIYEKLDLHSRSQLLARYFAEVYSSSL